MKTKKNKNRPKSKTTVKKEIEEELMRREFKQLFDETVATLEEEGETARECSRRRKQFRRFFM